MPVCPGFAGTAPTSPGRALLLIGPSSVGKTAIAEELQRSLNGPWLIAGVDMFWGMLDGGLTRGWHRAVGALAAEGNDLIVDELWIHRWWLDDWNEVLTGLRRWSVQLKASLPALREREAGRMDRPSGLAAADLTMAPEDWSFDLVIDTQGGTVADSAATIAGLVSG